MPTGSPPPAPWPGSIVTLPGTPTRATHPDFKRVTLTVAVPNQDSLVAYGLLLYNENGQVLESLDFDRTPKEIARKMYSPENSKFLRALANELLELPDVGLKIEPTGSALERDVGIYSATVEISNHDLIWMPSTFERFLEEAIRYEILNQLWLNKVPTEEESAILATQTGGYSK